MAKASLDSDIKETQPSLPDIIHLCEFTAKLPSRIFLSKCGTVFARLQIGLNKTEHVLIDPWSLV